MTCLMVMLIVALGWLALAIFAWALVHVGSRNEPPELPPRWHPQRLAPYRGNDEE